MGTSVYAEKLKVCDCGMHIALQINRIEGSFLNQTLFWYYMYQENNFFNNAAMTFKLDVLLHTSFFLQVYCWI